jgi:glyoxylase-like metal-dependent hydrolase (beta-lactamase superfamily II)
MKTKLFALALTLATTACASQPSVYTFESDANGFHTKSYFYDNGREVVAFDTQFTPELARQSIAFLRTKTQNPITYVVITHPNPDKFNGLGEFQKLGAKVVASRATAEAMPGVHAYKKYFFVQMAKMFTESQYPALGQVDETFEGSEVLRLSSGDTVELRELSRPGISSTQTVAYLPKARALVVGDLVHHGAHAWLEGGIVNGAAKPELQGWIADLEEIESLYDRDVTVLGGRGKDASVKDAVKAQKEYLQKAEAIVEGYLTKLGARRDELKSDKAGAHYKALAAEFEKAFPGLSLGYLIEYGIYGLVNAKL